MRILCDNVPVQYSEVLGVYYCVGDSVRPLTLIDECDETNKLTVVVPI